MMHGMLRYNIQKYKVQKSIPNLVLLRYDEVIKRGTFFKNAKFISQFFRPEFFGFLVENRSHIKDRNTFELSKTLKKRIKSGDRVGCQTRIPPLILESPKYLHNESECAIGYIGMLVFRICCRSKN